jgi:mono/diheme cytochrome c family protein
MGSLRRVLQMAALSALLLAGSSALAQDDPVLVAQGRRLFEERGCYACHAVAGTGGKTAPDLSNIGHRYSQSYLTYWLRDNPHRGAPHMPKPPLTEAELSALTAYLVSLRGF